MATYREIHGKAIRTYSSDPTLDSTYEGQVWYNSTSNTFKTVAGVGGWSTTSSLPVVNQLGAGMGTATAGLTAGGYGPTTPPFSSKALTLEFNGVGWLQESNLGTARHALGGFGIQTAAVVFGGKVDPGGANPANVEEYNGSTWSEETDQPAAMQGSTGAGTLTAGLSIGGQTGPGLPNRVTTTLEYDGTNWTSGGALPAAKTFAASAGTQTAGLAFGGNIAPDNAATTTEEYNGTSWTSVPGTMNTAVFEQGSTQNGTQTAALSFGGNTTPAYTAFSAKTEEYDGTTWTEKTSMPAATNALMGFGSNTNAIAAGGSLPTITSNCYEYNFGINTITNAAWASGPSINTGRRGMQNTGIGSATAGLIVGGVTGPGPTVNKTEEYDGSSWTETGNYPTNLQNGQGAGIQTAAYVFGGSDGSSELSAGNTYDGSSWTSGTALPTATWIGCGAGTAPTAILAGGATPGSPTPSIATTLEYASGSWTAGGSLSTARRYHGGFGTQTSMTVYGGKSTPGPVFNSTEEYNGSSWTSGGNFVAPTFISNSPASPSGDAGMAINGRVNSPAATTVTALYNGTAWAVDANTATANDEVGAIGTSTTAIKAGGNPGGTTASEEYTAGTETITARTLTQS